MRDHDLLIEIKTKLEVLTDTCRTMADSILTKAAASEVSDHERRIRDLESKVWKAIGAVGLISLVATLMSLWTMSRGGG